MNQVVYFIGIGGTGMAAVAGLAKQLGYKVIGSDKEIYPPMSHLLDELSIEVKTPYSIDNLQGIEPDLVIVGNSISRGHNELEFVLNKQWPHMSFPEFVGTQILETRDSIVVAGTHGKTTTTSLVTHFLNELHLEPGFLIGGIPKNFAKGFDLGKGRYFVIEGDEYDTSCFDKNSKFLHYNPEFLIFNNLEFDHADIFGDLEEIDNQFRKLCSLVKNPDKIIANIDDEGVVRVLDSLDLINKVTTTSQVHEKADFYVQKIDAHANGSSLTCVDRKLGKLEFKTSLRGDYNIANFRQAMATCLQLSEANSLALLFKAGESFKGVKRRLENLYSSRDIAIFEDFAHHPTAVSKVIEVFNKQKNSNRVVIAFEPKNATSRRKIFCDEYANAFSLADAVYLGPCPPDTRIPEDERMDIKVLAQKTGAHCKVYTTNEELLKGLLQDTKKGDCVIFMSSGSFSNIQHDFTSHFQD